MITIFDLDYTLLDTYRFKNDLAQIVFGISTEEFCKSYKNNFKNRKENYNFDQHLQYLVKDNKIKPEKIKDIRSRFDKFIQEIDDYLYPEASEVLKKFQSQDNKLILLSFGDIGWQRLKIENLSIKNYFDQIVYESKSKNESEYFKSLKGVNEEILIINDNLKESHEMLRLLQQEGVTCKTIIVNGPYSKEKNSETKIDNIARLLDENNITDEHKLRIK